MEKPNNNELPPMAMTNLEIDLRITYLYEGEKDKHLGVMEALDNAHDEKEKFALILAYLRAAYGRGYLDALTDTPDDNILNSYGQESDSGINGGSE